MSGSAQSWTPVRQVVNDVGQNESGDRFGTCEVWAESL